MSGAANEPEAPHSLFGGEIVCPMWQSVYTQCGMWMTASAGVGGWSLGNGNAGGSSYLGSGLALADARSCASGAMRVLVWTGQQARSFSEHSYVAILPSEVPAHLSRTIYFRSAARCPHIHNHMLGLGFSPHLLSGSAKSNDASATRERRDSR